MSAAVTHIGGRPAAPLSGMAIARLLGRLSQACCQHTYLRKAGGARLWLECADCGQTTPGLHIGPSAPGLRGAGRVIPIGQDH
jgi:hypothetical protein